MSIDNGHAKLSPSAADRWMRCPGSVALTADMPDTVSEYAEEGRKAHELAAICLQTQLDATDAEGNYPLDMREHVQTYLDLVRAEAKAAGGVLYVEEKLEFDEWAPDGFGTADALIVSPEEFHIIDLKFGQGVKVHADTSQLKIYALGAYQRHELGHDFNRVTMTICQPRLDHIDSNRMAVEELLSFGADVKSAAKQATQPGAALVPGEKQCRWCRAKTVCRARAEANLQTAMNEFAEPLPVPTILSLEEIAGLLPKLAEIERWAGELQVYALEQALNGQIIPGYKLVEGRSMRKWTADAAGTLLKHPKSKELFEYKLVGIGAAEKVLGKKDEVFKTLTEKPSGKPALVPQNDKRKAFTGGKTSAQEDFSD